jgi:regulation of enolase protein 1 (concanavalin A-like superfamily)
LTNTSRRQGGALYLVLLACALAGTAVTINARGDALPPGWLAQDVADPEVPGSTRVSGSTWTVAGSGADIYGTADQFHFAYQAMNGDVDVSVRVADIQFVHRFSKAGLMIRAGLGSHARNAFVLVSPDRGIAFQRRTTTGGNTARTMSNGAAPAWLRLRRQGSQFTAFSSPDGADWTTLGTATVNMPAAVYVGLAVTSRYPGQAATATFTDLNFGSTPTVPSSWVGTDVGDPDLAGTNSVAGNGTFTVTGAGADIWDTSDEFRFLYQRVQGDVEIIAQLLNVQQIDVWSKAGVMIRESLTGGSKHAFMFGSGDNGWNFQRRLSTSGLTEHSWGSPGHAPGWVRLVREGSLFSAYASTDGNTWSFVGSDTMSMSQSAFVGLAVTSHNSGATTTAAFSNVVVRPYNGGQNQPPTVSLTSPSANATYSAPASMTLAAAGTDTDGSVSRVDFYAGSQLIGSDSSAPFSQPWNNVPAGDYSVRAVATDNEGATGSSASIGVTVNSPSNQAPTVSLTAPGSGASFNAGATITLTATASDGDGTVTSVDFYAGPLLLGSNTTSPYSRTWSNVPAGSYVLTAVARDNGGASRTSAGVNITVNGTAPRPTTLVFVASPDHNTGVTSYVLALHRAGDPVTSNPVATRDLGRPAIVGGEISVNISTTVDPLPAGSYYAVVRAIGPGGTSASAPSATFTK